MEIETGKVYYWATIIKVSVRFDVPLVPKIYLLASGSGYFMRQCITSLKVDPQQEPDQAQQLSIPHHTFGEKIVFSCA